MIGVVYGYAIGLYCKHSLEQQHKVIDLKAMMSAILAVALVVSVVLTVSVTKSNQIKSNESVRKAT